MTNLNYKDLGLKCGIEIHQQLEGHKLFCNCATEIRKDNPDFKIIRRLRASAGEEGKVDQAALHEQKKQKYFVYQGYNDINCEVELDESPPLPVNQEALKSALMVAKMLNCEIVDEIQVMRKTVIDGSNTSGFQRTMLIGMNGFVDVNGKKIGVDTVCLEEEACQIIERKKEYDVYNLSRLGIPLIEIATKPDISTPDEAKEVAAKLGMILRSTGACKRGIGTIRQDINLSIKGGARIEIKGFQDLRSIAKIMDYEIERQLKLINKGKKVEPEVRKAEADLTTSYLRPMPGMDRMYPETDIPPIDTASKTNLMIEVPELIDDKVASLSKQYGVDKEKIKKIMKEDAFGESKLKLFTETVDENKNLSAPFVCDTLLSYASEILRKHKGADPLRIKDHHFKQICKAANDGKISKGSIIDIMGDVALGKELDLKQYEVKEIDLEAEIIKLIKDNKEAPINALMGLLMAKHRGKVDGKKAMELLNKHKK